MKANSPKGTTYKIEQELEALKSEGFSEDAVDWVLEKTFGFKAAIEAVIGLEACPYGELDEKRQPIDEEFPPMLESVGEKVGKLGKGSLTRYDDFLGDLSPQGQKVQTVISSSWASLINSWATAEGRTFSACASEAIAIGLRQLLKDGSIPAIAKENYEKTCERQVVAARAKNILQDRLISLGFCPF